MTWTCASTTMEGTPSKTTVNFVLNYGDNNLIYFWETAEKLSKCGCGATPFCVVFGEPPKPQKQSKNFGLEWHERETGHFSGRGESVVRLRAVAAVPTPSFVGVATPGRQALPSAKSPSTLQEQASPRPPSRRWACRRKNGADLDKGGGCAPTRRHPQVMDLSVYKYRPCVLFYSDARNISGGAT